MTERLYNADSYIRSFQATVVSCTPNTDTIYKVVLDRTAFFPEGGGQSSDAGHLAGYRVIDVQEEQDEVVHYVIGSVEVGAQVQGELDWKKRYDKMQQHTAEHIVSGIIGREYGYQNVGFHLNDEIVTMDFDGVLTRQQLNELEDTVNQAVYANVQVMVQYPSKDELQTMIYRSKIEIEGQVRIVEIDGYDKCACCAPHIATTGEVGMIKFIDIQSHRGGVRVTMVCGRRALLDYQEKSEHVKGISVLLSAKETQVFAAVERLKEELQECKSELWRMQNVLVKNKLEGLTGMEKQVVLFVEALDMEHRRELVNQCVEKGIGLAAVFSGNAEDGYQYIIGSGTQDVRITGKALNEACSGRGGGQARMVQGSVSASKQEIEFVFDK